MSFNFRFASVLKLRRHQEKIEKQKLSELFSAKSQLKQKYRELENKCREEDVYPEKQSVRRNRQLYAQKHARHKQLTGLRQKLEVLETKVDDQRRQLAGANQQTRMMEKLKKNEKRAFIRRVEHLEQLQQNEIAIQRYNVDY